MKREMAFIFLMVTNALAFNITIPDPNLKAYLVSQYDTELPLDGEISIGEAWQVTGTINCSNKSISDMSGINSFIHATGLDFSNNQVISCPDLSAMTDLELFDCTDNLLPNLPLLPPSTVKLYVSDNHIANLPNMDPLVLLEEIYCNGNMMQSLPDLSSLTQLSILFCNNNELTTLPNLPSNFLFAIDCSMNQITSLPEPLPPSLWVLDCRWNRLSAIQSPGSTLALGRLFCSGNLLTELPGFTNDLEMLYCDNNSLNSLPALPSFLQELVCSHNFLDNLPSLPATLAKLDCSNNVMSSLQNMASVTSLRYLDCSSNLITEVGGLSELWSLKTVWFHQNLVTALPDVSSLTALTSMKCQRNLLDSGDCPEIQTIQNQELPTFVFNPQGNFAQFNPELPQWPLVSLVLLEWVDLASNVEEEILCP